MRIADSFIDKGKINMLEEDNALLGNGSLTNQKKWTKTTEFIT